jgi:hypothetical protein
MKDLRAVSLSMKRFEARGSQATAGSIDAARVTLLDRSNARALRWNCRLTNSRAGVALHVGLISFEATYSTTAHALMKPGNACGKWIDK